MKKRIETHSEMPYYHQDHPRPRTRRELLGQGFLAGIGQVFVPTASQLLLAAQTSYASCEVGSDVTHTSLPFISVDLAGGANIAGSNVMVGADGSQTNFLPDSGYALLGLNEGTAHNVVPLGGGDLIFHADSPWLAGITSVASTDTLSRTNGTIMCARSNNDTGNNPHSPLPGIAAAGASGELLATIGNNGRRPSGGRHQVPPSLQNASYAPTKISKESEARAVVDPGAAGHALGTLGPEVYETIEAISALHLDSLVEQQAIKEAIKCSYTQAAANQKKVITPDDLDPLMDANMTQILSADQIRGADRLRRMAAISKLVVGGYAGCGTAELPGYDYHNRGRALPNRLDFIAGQAIGMALEYAALEGRPLMMYISSDGSVDSNPRRRLSAFDDATGTRGWHGDNSNTAASVMLAYSPVGRPQLLNGSQMGSFNNSGYIVRTASALSDNVPVLAESVVANYLALSGTPIGSIQQRMLELFPTNSISNLSANEFSQIIGFAAPIA